MRDRVHKRVKLVQVTEEDARTASSDIEEVCRRYQVSPSDRDRLWRAFACFCTYLLLRNGELPANDGGAESINGNATD